MEMLKTVCDRVDDLMREGKDSALMGWSMCDIIEMIREEQGDKAADLARDYIIREVCMIADEEKYIEKAIKEARRAYLNHQLFDKDVTESEIENVSK